MTINDERQARQGGSSRVATPQTSASCRLQNGVRGPRCAILRTLLYQLQRWAPGIVDPAILSKTFQFEDSPGRQLLLHSRHCLFRGGCNICEVCEVMMPQCSAAMLGLFAKLEG
jgi:hypothetical protein